MEALDVQLFIKKGEHVVVAQDGYATLVPLHDCVRYRKRITTHHSESTCIRAPAIQNASAHTRINRLLRATAHIVINAQTSASSLCSLRTLRSFSS